MKVSIIRKHRKLAASVIILLALWAVSTIQNKMAVIGSPGSATVAIVQTANSNPGDAEIESMVRDAVAKAGGLGSVIQPGDQVVVKPNLVATIWPSGSGVVTNKTVVRTVVKMAQEAGAGEVIIAEGTASYRDGEGSDRFCTQKAFKDSGLDLDGDMRDDVTGAQLYDLNITCDPSLDLDHTWADPNYVQLVNLQDGLLRRTFYQSNLLQTCDVLITVPVLKNHGQGAITGGMKNRVGCAPCDLYFDTVYRKYKRRLVHFNDYSTDENTVVGWAVYDLNRARPADFCVTDGLVGITNGPVGSNNNVTKPNHYVRCILASKDVVACDTIQALLMGITPESVKYLMSCRNTGFGQTNPALITVVGKSVQDARNFYAPAGDSDLFPNGYGGGARCDLTSPTLSDITPADGANITGTVTVSPVGVSDNNGIIKSELYIDNQFVASNAASPFSLSFDSGSYSTGSHTIKVKVYDASLNEASHTHTIIIGQQASNGSITGLVKDASNNPISGATVSTNTGSYTTTTDSSGNYTLSNVVEGTYNVTASKTGYSPLTNNGISVTAGLVTPSNFTLHVNTGTITGTVRDAANVAISGATVSTNTGGYTTTTNSSGVYTLSNVTAGTYNVTATNAGYTSLTNNNVAVTATNTTTSNFTLQVNTGTITGTVRDAGNVAISGVTVSTNTGGYTTTTNSSGVYTLSNVTAGTYNVTASKSGYSILTNNGVTVTAANTTTSNFTLSALAFSIVQDFETMPTWSSTYNATWGDASVWSCVTGGQSGKFLQGTRPTHGSSIKTIVYTVPTNTTVTVSGYMMCPYANKNYFTELGFRLGTWDGSDYDNNYLLWTYLKKFSNKAGFDNGNGGIWTKYSMQVNTGSFNKITIGFKIGAEPGDGPTVGWDSLRIDGPPVCVAPTITTQPISTTVALSGSATFVVGASGSTPLTYTWRKNGTNISGATNSTYTIGSVASSDTGNYGCVVSNSCGTVTSSSAALVTGNFMTIMGAKSQANGIDFTGLMGKLVTATFGDNIYVEEPGHLNGLRITWPGNSILAGQLVDVAGTMQTTIDGERYLNVTAGTTSGTGTPKPIYLTVRSLGGGDWQWNSSTGAGQKGVSSAGLNNIGLLVSISGKVKQTGTGYMYVDDGSNVTDGTSTGVRVICDSTGYQIGDFVGVTGISSCYIPGTTLQRQLLSTQVVKLN